MKVPEAVTHKHYSHRLGTTIQREKGKEKEARDPDHRTDT